MEEMNLDVLMEQEMFEQTDMLDALDWFFDRQYAEEEDQMYGVVLNAIC